MATSSIKNQIYVKTKTVTGTTDENGTLNLDLSSNHTIISLISNRNNVVVPYVGGYEWKAIMCDVRSGVDYLFKVPNTAYTVYVTYI